MTVSLRRTCSRPLGGPPLDDPRFDRRPLLDEAQDLPVPVGHELTGRTAVALSDAAHDPWVLAAVGSCDQYDLAVVAHGFGWR